jgi:PHS family inorganic phosphate transporter-like MFS transporter
MFLILLRAFNSAIASYLSCLQWPWRLLLGIGIAPACFTLYARLSIEDTAPYKQCMSPKRCIC